MLGFLRCLGAVLVNKCPKALLGEIPFVGVLWEIAEDVWARWKEHKEKSRIADELQQTAAADRELVEKAVTQVVAEVAATQPPDVQENLAAYLRQVPGTLRRSFRRPEDPTGKSLPPTFSLTAAKDLIPLLPARLPRFKVGDQPLPGVPWQLTELLGVGGFGEVWKAEHVFLTSKPPLALKFCLDPDAVRFLRHEARLMDWLMSEGRRPGIVELKNVYLDTVTPCLAYEFINGGDLCGLMHDWHRQQLEKRVQLASQVIQKLARTLGPLHRMNRPIVHRDLKPANILVIRKEEGRFDLKIGDFGIGGLAARRSIAETTRGVSRGDLLSQTLRGTHTPLYASDEQIHGEKPDPRDDVHALGVIWFQLLTSDVERRVGPDFDVDLHELGVGEETVRILKQCVATRRDRRFPDAQELAEQIDSLLHKPKILPEKPSGEIASVTSPSTPAESAPQSLPQPPPITQPLAQTMGTRIEPPPPAIITPETEDIATQGNVGDTISNELGMKFAWVPPGKSWLGGGGGKPGTTEFTLPRGLWCGVYPVTQAEWQTVMGNNPAAFGGNPCYPVENVAWYDVQEFLKKLNAQLSGKGLLYRLPTDQEWEYICRGGPVSQEQSFYHFYFTRSKTDLIPLIPAMTNDISFTQVNFNGNHPIGSAGRGPNLNHPSEVGVYLPNPLGIYDLHGNVWEWTSSQEGFNQVVRGGGWHSYGVYCTAATRCHDDPELRSGDLGFRILAEPIPIRETSRMEPDKTTARIHPVPAASSTPSNTPKPAVSSKPDLVADHPPERVKVTLRMPGFLVDAIYGVAGFFTILGVLFLIVVAPATGDGCWAALAAILLIVAGVVFVVRPNVSFSCPSCGTQGVIFHPAETYKCVRCGLLQIITWEWGRKDREEAASGGASKEGSLNNLRIAIAVGAIVCGIVMSLALLIGCSMKQREKDAKQYARGREDAMTGSFGSDIATASYVQGYTSGILGKVVKIKGNVIWKKRANGQLEKRNPGEDKGQVVGFRWDGYNTTYTIQFTNGDTEEGLRNWEIEVQQQEQEIKPTSNNRKPS